MKIIKNHILMQKYSRSALRNGRSIGLVPTMGYLHEGHASLLKACRSENDISVLSIFVNPKQFGPNEDLSKYPRDFKRDEKIARAAGVDVVFYPSVNDMYSDDHATYVDVEALSENLCGRSRPGHFRGVTTIVAKLFNIISPDVSYFGQKDAQQALIIKRMAAELDYDINIRILPTIRDKDGLAKSSRNVYLNQRERTDAVCLFESLEKAQELFNRGERRTSVLISGMRKVIKSRLSAKIDYIKCVDIRTLKDVEYIGTKALLALAVFVGKTRLIDNCILGGELNG